MATPLVILVGEIGRNLHHARDLILAGSVVVLAPTIEAARGLLVDHVPDHDARSDREIIQVGDLVIDRKGHRALWRDALLPLTEQELQLLGALAEAPGRAWSFDELLVRVWGTRYGGRATVSAAIRRLRRKLDEVGATVRIQAVRGVGFRLDR